MHKRLDMYHRAKPDVRPASIAFPLETEASLLAHSQTAANLARVASSDFIRCSTSSCCGDPSSDTNSIIFTEATF